MYFVEKANQLHATWRYVDFILQVVWGAGGRTWSKTFPKNWRNQALSLGEELVVEGKD